MCGLGEKQIWRYENGDNDPTADVLILISKHLSISVDYLLGLTDDPSGHITEEDLSPMERRLIQALRQGRLIEAFSTATDIAKKENDDSNAAPSGSGS